ncbi:GTP 3',8-cyclase [Caldicellulosiruptor diazotrophicus]|uniref:GTP 3',8-cyclase n=1 Tax=Caldicellulosiruptor diazotrophicus TaxID=2806205 RepID=A0ABN6E884_9FIRM|nr:GTP 3',8-cyclase MoaA [Caldicellulosiruptor diazotrophicus]BCS81683.1 GTP 3',8-cyclase [Caldicellulosiruptor diazotrophicus]
MFDGFSRKIDYLRLSVTDKCNFYCMYCRKKDLIYNTIDQLSKEEIFMIISAFKKLGIQKLRITGGEPFLRNDIFEIIDFAHSIGIKNINITTNGWLDTEKIKKVIKSPLKSINISLDTLEREKFRYVTGIDGLDKVLRAIDELKEYKRVKINTVLIRSVNLDEIEDLISYAKKSNIIIRFIELMPIGIANQIFEDEFVSKDEVIKRFKGIKEVATDKVSTAKYYYVEDFDYTVGFISSVSDHFCKTCNKVRVSSTGVLYNCLFDTNGLKLRDYLDAEELLLKKIEDFVKKKKLIRSLKSDMPMFRIGG